MTDRGRVQGHFWWHHLLTALVGLAMYGLLGALSAEIAFLGYLAYLNLPSPLSLIFGIALVGIGVSFFFISVYELVARVVSVRYTQTHCVICR